MTARDSVQQQRRRPGRLPACGPIVVQNRNIAVWQQDPVRRRLIRASRARQKNASKGLEMAIAQQRVWLKGGKTINDVTQRVDRSTPSNNTPRQKLWQL